MDFLKHTRNKSSDTKARYSFFIAFFITFVIAIVWGTTLPAHFSDMELSADDELLNPEDSQNFTDILNEAKSQAGNIIGSLEDENVLDTDSLNALENFEQQEQQEQEESVKETTEENGIDIKDDTVVAEEDTLTEEEPLEESFENVEPRTVLIEIKEFVPDNGTEVGNLDDVE